MNTHRDFIRNVLILLAVSQVNKKFHKLNDRPSNLQGQILTDHKSGLHKDDH